MEGLVEIRPVDHRAPVHDGVGLGEPARSSHSFLQHLQRPSAPLGLGVVRGQGRAEGVLRPAKLVNLGWDVA
jgi:hypothetical protein